MKKCLVLFIVLLFTLAFAVVMDNHETKKENTAIALNE